MKNTNYNRKLTPPPKSNLLNNSLIKCIGIAALIIIVLESCFFNFRWIKTSFENHEPAAISYITANNADLQEQDGRTILTATASPPSLVLQFDEPNQIHSLTIDLIPTQSSNIWMNMGFNAGAIINTSIYNGVVDSNTILANASASASAKADFYDILLDKIRNNTSDSNDGFNDTELVKPIASQPLMSNIPATETIILEPQADATTLTVAFPEIAVGSSIAFDLITTNAAVPFNLSVPRLVLEILIAAFIIAVRPKSGLRKLDLSQPKVIGITAITIGIIITIAATVFVCFSTNMEDYSGSNEVVITDTRQYQHMADSLLQGKEYLDLEVPEWLAELDNPYDKEVREQTAIETGQKVFFDYAYHDGKYYMYFGVLPAALLFAPYKLLTDTDLSTPIATLILSIIACLLLWLFTLAILQKYSKNTSVGDFILYDTLMFLASGLIYLTYYPSFYHIAILAGLILALLGITFWLFTEKNGRIRRIPLVLGCTSIALTLLARPTFFLSILLIFPILWNNITGKPGYSKEFFALNKRAIINTLCVFLPFIFVGMLTMYWNYIRFQSPLDFGSNYNLTGFDMTTRHNSILASTYSYLIFLGAPPLPAFPDFPYILRWPGMHIAIVEPYYFGAFFAMPAFWILVAIFKKRWRKSLKDQGSFGIVLFGIITALLIIAIDVTVAVTQRYQSDFNWIFAMVTIIMCCTFKQTYIKSNRKRSIKIMNILLIICIVIAIVLIFLNLFDFNRYRDYQSTNPQLYWSVASWFLI